jgi:putative membrane protein
MPAASDEMVMLGLAAGTLIGVALGALSGLAPGIHANTLASALLATGAGFAAVLGEEALAAAMFAALITHSFLDNIPTTFLGVPEAETALAVLPAHALCLEGRGEEAVRCSALGSALAMAFAVPLSLVAVLLLPPLQPALDWGIGILLVAVVGYMILSDDSPTWAFAIFAVSGAVGLFALRYGFLAWHPLGGDAIFLPLLSGLFGLPVLLTASHGPVPEQRFSGISIPTAVLARHSLLGTFAGLLVGWLPGLSNATANGLLDAAVGYDRDRRGFIVATSAANTANAFIGLAALFAIGRARSGVLAAMAALSLPSMAQLMVVGLAAAIAGFLLTVRPTSSARHLGRIDGRVLNLAVVGLLVLLSATLAGPFGLLVLALATAVGLVPPLVNVRRVHAMGAIMLPVMAWSFGFAGF